jgi:hypothetical protein
MLLCKCPVTYLVASIIALNVREGRHIAITSSVNLHMRVCMRV